MLRNWWTDIGRNTHVGFCGSSHNTIIDCFGFFLIEIYSAWLRKGLKLFMTWDGEYVKLASFTWKKGESYDRVSFYSLFLVTNNSTKCHRDGSLTSWLSILTAYRITVFGKAHESSDHRIIGLFSLSHEQNLTFRLSERKIKLAWSFPIVRKVNEVKLALIMPWREDKGVCQFRRI